jgi:hypothetical protein
MAFGFIEGAESTHGQTIAQIVWNFFYQAWSRSSDSCDKRLKLLDVTSIESIHPVGLSG